MNWTCPHCKNLALESHETGGRPSVVRAGDYALCGACGQLSRFTVRIAGGWAVRPLTAEEERAVPADVQQACKDVQGQASYRKGLRQVQEHVARWAESYRALQTGADAPIPLVLFEMPKGVALGLYLDQIENRAPVNDAARELMAFLAAIIPHGTLLQLYSILLSEPELSQRFGRRPRWVVDWKPGFPLPEGELVVLHRGRDGSSEGKPS